MVIMTTFREQLEAKMGRKKQLISPFFNSRKEIKDEVEKFMKQFRSEIMAAILETLDVDKIVNKNKIALAVLKKEVTPKKGIDYRDGFDGKPGESYTLTDRDKQEIAKNIDVPVVEKIVEKTLIEKPTITEIVKEKALKDEPLEIANKLNTLEEVIEPKVIKGLNRRFNIIDKNISTIKKEKSSGTSGGGMGNVQHQVFNISAGTTSVTTTYPISGRGNAIFKANYEGSGLDKDVQFTVGNDYKTITFSSETQAQFINNTVFSITYIRG